LNEFKKRRVWGPEPSYDLVETYTHPRNDFTIISGPCSFESTKQLEKIVSITKSKSTHLRSGVFRAGTYKGKNFGWIDKDLIQEYRRISKESGLKNIIELLDYRDMDWISQYCDCFQVGARQTQNYTLLNEVGKSGKPVFLKRNMGMTLDEFLGAANYVLCAGCNELYLIERGSSTYHNDVRWTPTVHLIPSIKSICNIPVIWDASHATGRRDLVPSICLSGVAAGAGGVLIETHYSPEESLSDADQAIDLETFEKLIEKINLIRGLV
jgi:3-deoxy-7-phosphoheptulonate synthase